MEIAGTNSGDGFDPQLNFVFDLRLDGRKRNRTKAKKKRIPNHRSDSAKGACFGQSRRNLLFLGLFDVGRFDSQVAEGNRSRGSGA